jgi:hypothetical protein
MEGDRRVAQRQRLPIDWDMMGSKPTTPMSRDQVLMMFTVSPSFPVDAKSAPTATGYARRESPAVLQETCRLQQCPPTLAALAENDWRVHTRVHAKRGGPPPPESVKQRAEELRRRATSLKRQLGW